MSFWTPERVAELRQLTATGMTYAEIGQHFGITKNAAVGKAQRLGLDNGYQKGAVWSVDMDRTLRQAAQDGLTMYEVASQLGVKYNSVVWRAATLEVRFPKSKPPKPVPSAGCTWGAGKQSPRPVPPTPPVHPMAQHDQATVLPMQLEPRHCKWPVGEPGADDFGFCGAARAGDSSYCAHHRARSVGVTPKHRTANELARSLRRFA